MASAAPRMHARQPAVRLIALPQQSGTSLNSKVSVGFAAGSGLQNQVLPRNGAAPRSRANKDRSERTCRLPAVLDGVKRWGSERIESERNLGRPGGFRPLRSGVLRRDA